MEQSANLPQKELPALIGTIEDVPAGTIKNALVTIGISDQKLMALRADTDSVLDIWDGSKESYERVRRHRLDNLRPTRIGAVKTAEDGRAEANQVQKLWIKAEKAVVGFIESDEARCFEKERQYEAEIQRKAEEAAAKEKARVDALLTQLAAYEWQGNPYEVAQDAPERFAERLAKAKESFEAIVAERKAEAERKAREEQAARELAEASRKEAVRLAKIEADQKAEAEKLRKEREDFERQQREAREAEEARQRKAKEDSDRAERERLSRIADEERRQREAAEAEARRLQAIADAKAKEDAEAKAAEEERARLAALAPDIDKVWAWARGVWDVAQHVPTVRDHGLQDRVESTAKSIDEILNNLRLSAGK